MRAQFESCLLHGMLFKLYDSPDARAEHARRYCEIHDQLPALLEHRLRFAPRGPSITYAAPPGFCACPPRTRRRQLY